MEKYDYYAINAAWNGANVSQRADDLKAAEKIADDLKGNGFIDVVIFGVKAGKREKLEGGKQAKQKAQERPRKDTKPKAQDKAAPKVKTPVKSAKKPQDNGGQLDLFLDAGINKSKTIELNQNEIQIINYCLKHNDVFFTALPIITKNQFNELCTTIEKSLNTTNSVKFLFKDNELRTIALSLNKEYMHGSNAKFNRIKLLELKKFFKDNFS